MQRCSRAAEQHYSGLTARVAGVLGSFAHHTVQIREPLERHRCDVQAIKQDGTFK